MCDANANLSSTSSNIFSCREYFVTAEKAAASILWGLTTIARNSSTVSLNEKVKRTFNRLEGHQQAGAVYFWLILDTIINITPDVAAGLRKQIKTFGEKDVAGIYPKGKNIE